MKPIARSAKNQEMMNKANTIEDLKYLKIYKPEKYAEECKRLGIVEPVYPMKVNKNKS